MCSCRVSYPTIIGDQVLEQQHLNWDAHVKTLLRKGQFWQFYRLSYNSFCVLHLYDQLKMNRNQNNNIAPEIIMNCTLRYHAGGSHQDIPVTTGLSVSTFYNLHPSWYWCNQQTSSTIITVSYDRRGAKKDCCRIPSKKFFRNDGWLHRFIGWMLCRLKVPTPKQTSNVSSYLSGHYQWVSWLECSSGM